jgi:ABC-type polysaccharide/polyol phosphate transport system ATPase subunit
MERIIIENISKEFKIGFRRKQSVLARILNTIFGRIPTKKLLAIENLSFTANSGEIIGIIGKNGSGKSTLLRLIAGIYKPTQGNIETNGKIISLINLNIGLKPRLTLKDNLYLVGALFDLGRKDIKQRFNKIVEFAGLTQFTNTKISQFSTGMTQRLVFSIAAHANPEILLLDEVFEVGDEDFRKKSSNKIKELAKNGATVLLVSHELWMIEKYCNKVIWIDKGNIKKQGKTKEIVKEYEGK